MKTIITTSCIATVLALTVPAGAQSWFVTPPAKETSAKPEPAAPTTIKDRLDAANQRYSKAIEDFRAILTKATEDPGLLTARSTFDSIDKIDRSLKTVKSVCLDLRKSLEAQSKAFDQNASGLYDEQQTKELKESADALGTSAYELQQKTETILKNLGQAPAKLGNLKKVFNTYKNLKGETEAMDRLKAGVEAYSQAIETAEKPAEKESAGAESEKAPKSE